MRKAAKNSVRLAQTTVAPTGVEAVKETTSPTKKHPTDVTAAEITTPRKLLNSCMAVRAGKITREEGFMMTGLRQDGR